MHPDQQEREHYEYGLVEGKIVHKRTKQLLDTSKGMPGAKWIFVMSTSKKFYAGEVRTKVNLKNYLIVLCIPVSLNYLSDSQKAKMSFLITFRKRKESFTTQASLQEELLWLLEGCQQKMEYLRYPSVGSDT